MAMIKAKNIKKIFFIFSLIIIISGGLFFAYQCQPEIYAQLNDWKLIPAKEHFTELYFENHLNLPKQIIAGRQIDFSFTIHNLEGQMMDYPYAVYFVSDSGEIITISDSAITVADGEYKTIPETYTLDTLAPSGAVYVDLVQKKQDIHFNVIK
jgi:hypothetical protein